MRIDKKLQAEISNQIPDIQSKIANKIDWNAIKAHNPSRPKIFRRYISIALSCVACVSLILMMILLLPKDSRSSTSYNITIEVNPCIRLVVDNNDIVTNQYGLNKDGVIFLYKANFIGMNVIDANKAVIDKLNKAGFLTDTISIKVINDNGKSNQEKQSSITNSISDYLNQLQLDNISLIEINEVEFDKIEDYYEENDIDSFAQGLITKFRTELNYLRIEMQTLLDSLTPYIKQGEELNIDKVLTYINNFTDKYNYDLDFDIIDSPTMEELDDLYEELCEDIEYIDEALNEDINNDEYEILEVLLELIKENLYGDFD